MTMRGSLVSRYGLGLSCVAMIAGCTQADGINTEGATFDAISKDAAITLVGTEPFWNIDIAPADGFYSATFATPENTDGSPLALDRFAGNNGLGFSGELEGRAIQITLTPGECSDGMSDRGYPYTATIAWGESTLYGCGFTSDEPFIEDEEP